MSDDEFSINEDVFSVLLAKKNQDGYSEKSWNDWFKSVFGEKNTKKYVIEKTVQRFFYKNDFEQWVKSFAENLQDIWIEPSANKLKIDLEKFETDAIIVIGAGPSLRKHKHLEILAESSFKGAIICTDRSLIPALKAGVTPEKFPKFYVITIDAYPTIKKYYDDEIVNKYGCNIQGIFSVLTYPSVIKKARDAGINIHWIHTLFDYDEGKKSFNHISALMIRSKDDTHRLPAIQTGGNVGTSAWFVSWLILKYSNICLIGINHGWEEDDSIELIMSHGNAGKLSEIKIDSEIFKKLYPKIYNPEFNTYCILDPIFQYYSSAFKEFIERAPESIKTINSTEGGSIFGKRVTCMPFKKFLLEWDNDT